ncbi:serine/threonine protein kinase [Aquincola sp. S2]|uniref:Serine/threonine protein kinase n=1 Tax=Pseudaquabacterium terrae TaxID=2732868 RepID=A0ABX2EN55_9BURK|nr:serine/threonine-protein kinase [Aquabacterium terrae]NRF70053.1 serine/threonine protein kinase [Aquabacterium terrae]
MHAPFDLSADDWSTLRRLLDEALSLPAQDRVAWLAGLPATEHRFAPRLRALLSHAQRADAGELLHTLPKIETGVFAGRSPAYDEAPAEPGRFVGPYRLLRELGEGGMASVWLAERSDLLQGRQVALKLPRASWRHAAWAERLAREREILATLEHPNIARLYDAGIATDGQPYLALEFVEGDRIDEHCRSRKLDVRPRLRLFLQVARAVAHAHAKLVVHRDLKPSNILVTSDGQVRLLDFGIAKLLDQGVAKETQLTLEHGRALTPDYAAPEQIRGEPIGTAADIYSLGVLLYELLAGERPYRLRRGTRAELEESILLAEPQRPSDAAQDRKLARLLRGDLDTIVLKTLKKAPAERYATVDALAADIERHLADQPVQARPDSRSYRLRKLIARNKLESAAAAGTLVAVLSGTGVALWQASEAARQRDAALQHQQRAEAFSEFMYTLLDDVGSSDQPLTMPALLDRGTAMLERQRTSDPALTAYLQYEISRKYTMVNQTHRVLSLLQRSADGARAAGDHGLLAAALCATAWSLAEGQASLARTRLSEAEQALARATLVPMFARADCHRARARVQQASGDLAGAIITIQRGIAEIDRSGVDPGSRGRIMRVQLADFYRASDRYKDALALSAEELELHRQAGSLDSRAGFVALNNHAGNLNRLGEHVQAQAMLDQAQAWVAKQPPSLSQPVGFASNYGFALLRMGHAERALALAEESLRQSRPAKNVFRNSIGELLAASALRALQRPEEALRRLEAAEAVWRADPRAHGRMLQAASLLRAELLLDTGRAAEARVAIDAALAKAGYPGSSTAPGVDRLLRGASRIHKAAGDAVAAEALASAALEASRRIARDERLSGDVGEAALLRAQGRHALGRDGDARRDALLAHEALRNGLGSQHALTAAAAALLAKLPGS